MRKIFLFMMVSLDGYIEGENHDLSWHNVDEEFNKFASAQMQEMGTILFGRRTYELMHSYWPHATATDSGDQLVKDTMNTIEKIVFSHSLENVEDEENWKNVRLIKQDVAAEIARLKEKDGKDIAVLGSNNLCLTLLELGLLDEIRIMLNPIVIGKGTPLFTGRKEKKRFQLSDIRNFKNGNVLLTYQASLVI